MKTYTKQDIALIGEQYDLKVSQVEFLYLLAQSKKPLRASEIISELSITSRQALKRLMTGMDALLSITGNSATLAYSVNHQSLSLSFMSIDFKKRSDSHFDKNRLRDYQPNHTFLLSKKMRDELLLLSRSALKKLDTINQRIFKRLLIDFSWESSRLEGNSYTLLETEELIDRSIKAAGRSKEDHIMIQNHAKAMTFLIENSQNIKLTSFDIRSIHFILSKNLMKDSNDCGAIRHKIITVSESRYIPEQAPSILDEQLELMSEKSRAIEDPFEQSFFLMVNIAYLQPFSDVNKRTGRVLANYPLLKNSLCPASLYGINQSDYLMGLAEYYETGETHLIADAYLKSYEQSIVRYKESLSTIYLDEKENIIDEIISQWIQARLKKGSSGTPIEKIRFIKARLDQKESDIPYHDVIKAINNIDPIKVFSFGLTLEQFNHFQSLALKDNHPIDS